MPRIYCLTSLLFCSLLLRADSGNPKPDARFKVDLLVVVAHPDDETEIGAYLARAIFDEKKRVAVVFGTRGNSGGNSEGQEQAAALGAIREIEGRQALAHFGVSEVWFLNGTDTAGQDVLDSLETWGHGDSLGRLVRLVRITRPSVIATWLPAWVAGENHGDHQAAGVLATEAFDLAADETAFPEQLAPPRNRDDIDNLTEGLRPWQPEKIYYFSDASHTDFITGKGPSYAATGISGARNTSYARLAAEECAYHLTQGDSGQVARAALAKNDLHAFESPVLFIFGKSLVKSSVIGDLFEGVAADGVEYQPPPGYSTSRRTAPEIELGGPWRFYQSFYRTHGLGNLANLLSPEIMARFSSRFVIPVVVDNPTDTAVPVKLSIDLPTGWTFRRQPDGTFTVGAHQSYSYLFEAVTAASQSGWKTISIDAESDHKRLGALRVRVQLEGGAMPQ